MSYSQIFKFIESNVIKKQNLNIKNVTIGFFCCRNQIDDILLRFPDPYKFPFSRVDSQFTIARDPTKWNESSENCKLILTSLPGNRKQWKGAILGFMHQACDLNVLVYSGVIPESEAIKRAPCLDSKSLSIFKIADFILERAEKIHIPDYFITNQLKIVRYDIQNGTGFIIEYLNKILRLPPQSRIEEGVFVIFKLYEVDFLPTQRENEAGHVLCFWMSWEEGVLNLIDPQLNVIQTYGNVDSWGNKEHLILKGYEKFQFIDLICMCDMDQSLDRKSFVSRIRKRPDIHYGGKDKIPNVEWYNGYNKEKFIGWIKENETKEMKKKAVEWKQPKEYILISSIKQSKSQKQQSKKQSQQKQQSKKKQRQHSQSKRQQKKIKSQHRQTRKRIGIVI